MRRIRRRDFVRGSVAAGVTLALPFSRARGANDDIRVAVVGIRNQGSNHINWFRNIPGVRVVAICDADKSFLDREEKKFRDRNERVDTYVDYRKLLEDKNIDAIITATPNHWHALVTVWGCQAGKDVYVEKPVSHNIWEGRKMVDAAHKYNRIVQSGTQRRSDEGLQEAIEYIQQGNLGKETSREMVCEAINGNKEMVDSFERFQEHLLVNGVDVKATPRILGPWLKMDTDNERFVGDFHEQANELVKRKYRGPFVVPEQV